MADTIAPKEVRQGTKQRLIEAAIPLFAEGGLDSVSIRNVNQAADVANQSAIYYHFGDMWGLVSASLQHSLDPYVVGVHAALDIIEAELFEGEAPELTAIVEALIRPMVQIAIAPKGLARIKFIARLIGGAGDRGRILVAEGFRDLTIRCNRLVFASLPELGEEGASIKVLFAFNSVINIVSDIGLEKYWPLPTRSTDRIDRYLRDYIEGGIRFSSRPPTNPSGDA